MGRLRAFSGNPYMTVDSRRTGAARPPSWFEPESSDLIGRAPAKASSHWFPHSLSSLARLEGTLQCWLVALNRPEKKASVSKVWGKRAAEKSAKASRAKRPVEERMSSTKEPTALFACSKCFTRHPFEELSQGQQLCKVSPRIYMYQKSFFGPILGAVKNMLILFTNPVASH